MTNVRVSDGGADALPYAFESADLVKKNLMNNLIIIPARQVSHTISILLILNRVKILNYNRQTKELLI